MAETAVVWFRRDLRVHDNEPLTRAAVADEVVPIYCFDPREYGRREFGGDHSFSYRKTGPHRTRFRREAVADLRDRLRERGSDLIVRAGTPGEVLPDVIEAVDADQVLCQTLPTAEEMTVENEVKAAVPGDVDVRRFWTHTLYHINDLPIDYRNIQDTFTPFRKKVEAGAAVREPERTPSLPAVPAGIEAGELPSLAALGVDGDDPEAPDDRGVLGFEGGETAALARVDDWMWDGDHLRHYKETRNGMVGPDYSSKFSAWLAEGCLSPRYVHDEVDRYEDVRVDNEDTYWLIFELIWRDFWQFQFAKHGRQFFARGGIRSRTDVDWREDDDDLRRWQDGETGIPFVDANMRELNATGYMSNRGRQNVASFLAKNLRIDWRHGAAYFETQLVDYDPASNYGNWAYVAGVGNDSRDNYFNIVKQARRYDGDAAYVKRWCPELEPLPAEYAHEPWKMTPEEQAEHGVELGVDYPRPMLDLEASYRKLR